MVPDTVIKPHDAVSNDWDRDAYEDVEVNIENEELEEKMKDIVSEIEQPGADYNEPSITTNKSEKAKVEEKMQVDEEKEASQGEGMQVDEEKEEEEKNAEKGSP